MDKSEEEVPSQREEIKAAVKNYVQDHWFFLVHLENKSMTKQIHEIGGNLKIRVKL